MRTFVQLAEETDGTVFAYVIAALVLGVGALGLALGLRKKPPSS